ncbi:MAG TPA: DUF1269 domain-containing protein [Gammaproteobacteria bacterium]|nr:DUF1269 domain-containing protein [Gammaproteobacteria bacterium]
MNRRLYFVLPDVDTAQQVERDLLLAKIEDRHMHFLGKRGTDLKDLPEASLGQKTDLFHGMRVGLVAGGATGTCVGFILYQFPSLIGVSLDVGIVAILALVGAIFGAWVSSMIGSSTPNVRLREYEKTMEEGHILLMLDVPKERIDEVREIIRSHHPEVEDHGLDPDIPRFP